MCPASARNVQNPRLSEAKLDRAVEKAYLVELAWSALTVGATNSHLVAVGNLDLLCVETCAWNNPIAAHLIAALEEQRSIELEKNAF